MYRTALQHLTTSNIEVLNVQRTAFIIRIEEIEYVFVAKMLYYITTLYANM